MSELIATAQVLITPDTTKFRGLLEAEILSATKKPLLVPVQPLVVGGNAQAAAGATSELVAAQKSAQAATLELTAAIGALNKTLTGNIGLMAEDAAAAQAAGAAHARAAVGTAIHADSMAQVQKASVASAAGLLGLRGAVLTAGTAFIAAVAGIQAFGKAVGSFAEFTRTLAVFRVTAGATADEMARVSERARELGRDITLPGVSAGDAAQTLTELSKAGLSVQQSLDAAQGTLQLATAAEIDNAKAAELVANSLNAFQLSGADAARVADLLAGAANASQGSIEDMGLALKQAAAAAHLVGLDVNDTVTLLTELARAGLSASDAGTSLRTLLVRLVGDFPKVSAEVDRLGLALRDASGNLRPEFFSELGDKLEKMTPKTRQATVALLGGADAIRSLSILSRSSTVDFDATNAAISRSGIAAEVASAQTEGLGGDVEATKNEFADLGLTVGKVASGPLSLLVRTAGQAAGAVNDMNAEVEKSAGGGGFFHQLGLVVDDFAGSFARLNIQFQQGVRNAQGVEDRFTSLDAATVTVTGSINALADALERAGRNTLKTQGRPDSGLNVQGVLNRVTGFDTQETAARIRGDTEDLLSVLQDERDFLLQQLDRKFVKNRPALFRALQDALLGVTNDINAIQKQGIAKAEQGARDNEAAAREAATAQAQATQAFIDSFAGKKQGLQNKLTNAQLFGPANQQIAVNKQIIAADKAEIDAIKARIKHLHLHGDALKLAQATIATLNQEIFNTENAITQLQQTQKEATEQVLNTKLDLRIQIAQTTGNVAAEIKARRAKLDEITKELVRAKKAFGKNSVAWLELKAAQAEQIAAIKDLQDQQGKDKSTGKTFAQQSFEFLQKQQGFAANLLGNLIPGSATQGLVGGSTPAEQGVQAQAAVATAKDSNFSRGQGDTTNHILRQILKGIMDLNGRAGHPEAKHQHATGGAGMDVM